ncbi:hypothetical protein FRC18_000773 [Serendipita sp. 400]|nr:hypothetical protein FRC18_000773 [Serendipita sp. 400]
MPHTIAELEIGFFSTVTLLLLSHLLVYRMVPGLVKAVIRIDTVGDRALSIQVVVDGDMTIEKCTAQGFFYAGIEYSHEYR